MQNEVDICAVGDIFISRRIPREEYDGFSDLKQLIGSHDVRFANLETTVHRDEGTPGAVSGGTWSKCPPEALDDLGKYGFNIFNAANNHALDYSQDGLLATMHHLEKRDFLYAGIGRNLSDAAAPVYIDSPHCRVALIGVTSSFASFWAAGNQKHDMKGRPGVNPLRFQTNYHVLKEDMKVLKLISDGTKINSDHELAVAEGFETEAPGVYMFGGKAFVEDEKREAQEIIRNSDLNRIIDSIHDARANADYVLVSIHSHQTGKGRKDYPADFLRDFAHACIDSGATAVIGHGPHILRGIERYNSGIIFYSLGNFLFENDTVAKLPADLLEKYGLNERATVSEARNFRSKDGTIGLAVNPKVWHSVVASMHLKNWNIQEIKLYPLSLHGELPVYRRGLPTLTKDEGALKEVQKLSEQFNTEIIIRDGVGIIRL